MNNDNLKDIVNYFPVRMRGIVDTIIDSGAEEIRLRVKRPLQSVSAGKDCLHMKYMISTEDCKELYENFCRHSVYSCEDDTRQGFITLPVCGVRVGISGNVYSVNGSVQRFCDITGFCIRLPKEYRGESSHLISRTGGMYNASMLVASSPGVGKTTLLRDMARELSDLYSKKICIVDERSEIAGCDRGVPYYDVGFRTDVLDNCPKEKGILMAIRTLSPDVIITDEAGEKGDFSAIKRAMNSGVSVICSVHADSTDDLMNNELTNDIFSIMKYTVIMNIVRSKRVCTLYEKCEKKEVIYL